MESTQIPDHLKPVAQLHEKIQAVFTHPSTGFKVVTIESHPNGNRVDVRAPWTPFLPPFVAGEMLKLGLVLTEVQSLFNNSMQPVTPSTMFLTYRKIDCDVKLDCTEMGHVVVREKLWRLP